MNASRVNGEAKLEDAEGEEYSATATALYKGLEVRNIQ